MTVGSRVSLPPAKSTLPPDDLYAWTQAFIAAFAAMGKGSKTLVDDYTEMQKINEAQAQFILQDTADVIRKENDVATLQGQIYGDSKDKDTMDTVSTTMMVIGIVVMALTFISGIFDGGLSDLALPEEGEAFFGEEAGDIAMDTFSGEAPEEVAADGTSEAAPQTAEEQTASESKASENISDAENKAENSKFARAQKYFNKVVGKRAPGKGSSRLGELGWPVLR